MKKQEYKELSRQTRLDNHPEIWKDIPEYEGLYQVSSKWEVKWLSRKTWFVFRREKILIASPDRKWYQTVSLQNEWYWKTKKIHRLVMLAFVWPSELQVNHIDWNVKNNSLENLEYCTNLENMRHSIDILKRKKSSYFKWKLWELNVLSKKIIQYDKDMNLIKEWNSMSDATRELWISTSNISSCCRKWYWTLKWYNWRFKQI